MLPITSFSMLSIIVNKRIRKPSRTDVAVVLISMLALFVYLLFVHVAREEWLKAVGDFIAIVAIRTYPWRFTRYGGE